ncbi:hypothetical protein [Pseudogracilibacillus sp. ICA-222130]|uniref:hypothetical protein n=1 Tax=Pseudogracilibacillus sp. ICA-222130 TaxID=3134655 RepID=UPI0030BC5DE4
MKKYDVKKKFIDFKDRYYVYNTEKDLLFYTRIANPFSKYGYDLWKTEDESLEATMFRKQDRKNIVFTIEKEGKEIARIQTNKGWAKHYFSIEPHGIHTTHNDSKLSYTLWQDDQELGRIDTKLLRLSATFTIELHPHAEPFLYLFIYFIIVMDKVNPSLRGLLFKRIPF